MLLLKKLFKLYRKLYKNPLIRYLYSNTMIELGGNIKLVGFNNIEPALLIVIKKITGNYVKKMSDKLGKNIHSLKLELSDDSGEKKIIGELKFNEKTENIESKNINLFFALDKVLSTLLGKI